MWKVCWRSKKRRQGKLASSVIVLMLLWVCKLEHDHLEHDKHLHRGSRETSQGFPAEAASNVV